jgi:hypothetical protein
MTKTKKRPAKKEKKSSAKRSKKTVTEQNPTALQLTPHIDSIPTEIQDRETHLPVGVGLNMQTLLERAVDKMVPIDYLERLLGMVEKQRAQWARERFFDDFALFQKDRPIIAKRAEARNTDKPCPICHGKPGDIEKCDECEGTGHPLLYYYAPLEDIIAEIGPIESRHGFSSTARSHPEKDEGLGIPMMVGSCLMHHKDGHTEETVVKVPIGEGTRMMSAMQKYRAAATFARRHAYIEQHGLGMKGEDVETSNEEPTPIATPQAQKGTTASQNGKRIEEKDETSELQAARTTVQEIYSKLVKDFSNNLDGTKDEKFRTELEIMKKQAQDARDDLLKLRGLAVDYQLLYTNKIADRGFAEGEKK